MAVVTQDYQIALSVVKTISIDMVYSQSDSTSHGIRLTPTTNRTTTFRFLNQIISERPLQIAPLASTITSTFKPLTQPGRLKSTVRTDCRAEFPLRISDQRSSTNFTCLNKSFTLGVQTIVDLSSTRTTTVPTLRTYCRLKGSVAVLILAVRLHNQNFGTLPGSCRIVNLLFRQPSVDLRWQPYCTAGRIATPSRPDLRRL